MSLLSPLSKPVNSVYNYQVSGIHSYNVSGGLEVFNGNIVTREINESNRGGNITFQIIEDHLTDGQQTFLFSLLGNDVSNISIPIYVIDTSKSPSYNLSSSATAVTTNDTSFNIYLTTTGLSAGYLVPFIISGVDTTAINYIDLSGTFVIDLYGTSMITFFASKNKQNDGDKTFTLTLLDFPISIDVYFTDTNYKPVFEMKSSLTTNYFQIDNTRRNTNFIGTNYFYFYLSTNTSVPNNTPTRYYLSGVNTNDISNIDLSGLILSSQNGEITDTVHYKKITILNSYTPQTLLIKASQQNIIPLRIGLNYGIKSPNQTVVPKGNVALDTYKVLKAIPNSIIYLEATLYGYQENYTYYFKKQNRILSSGYVYCDISGFQQTTDISFLFVSDVSFTIGDIYSTTIYSL